VPIISARRVARAFADGDSAATAHARGQALENLLIYIFAKFPGVRFLDKDIRVSRRSEEIDLVFWNDRRPSGLPFLPNLLLFECKNWLNPVDSASVVQFTNKVRTRHLEYGLLIAANGITGDVSDLTAAYQHLHNALIGDNIMIIVINREELCGTTSTERLTAILQQKIARLILRGG
jgi:restriction endonuclease